MRKGGMGRGSQGVMSRRSPHPGPPPPLRMERRGGRGRRWSRGVRSRKRTPTLRDSNPSRWPSPIGWQRGGKRALTLWHSKPPALRWSKVSFGGGSRDGEPRRDSLDAAPALHPLAKEIEEGQLQRTVGGQTMTGDAKPLASVAQGRAVGFKSAQVFFARGVWVNEQDAARF